jgi:phage gpG-like protein
LVEVDLVVLGGNRVRLGITKMARRAASPKPVLEDIVFDLMEAVDAVFRSEGRRGGGSWRADTLKWQSEKYWGNHDPRIKQATGDLRHSLTRLGHPQQLLRVTNSTIQYGTKLPYGRVHQKGYPPGNIPARPFLKFTKGDRVSARKKIARYIRYGVIT